MRWRLAVAAVLCASLTGGGAPRDTTTDSPPVWSSEFSGRRGAAPDPRHWVHEQGPQGWGQGELQAYTASRANAALDGRGHLRITALSRDEAGQEAGGAQWTSARLSTRDRYTVRYGRIEARIRVPHGQGIWPAFWMVGADIDDVGWPACGEIDVMESLNREARHRYSVHGPRAGDGGEWKVVEVAEKVRATDDGFHVYAVDWRADRIRFLVDGRPQGTVFAADLPPEEQWVFDEPFHLILNVAVGGAWPGPPDVTTPARSSMLVDWVRVYR